MTGPLVAERPFPRGCVGDGCNRRGSPRLCPHAAMPSARQRRKAKWVRVFNATLPLPQSSSASRFTAGASGFFIFSQSRERPERQGEPKRLLTMPSQPSLQACRKMTSPASWKCSFNWSPTSLPRKRLASVSLRTSIGQTDRERKMAKAQAIEIPVLIFAQADEVTCAVVHAPPLLEATRPTSNICAEIAALS
jgi:hypothetical protein